MCSQGDLQCGSINNRTWKKIYHHQYEYAHIARATAIDVLSCTHLRACIGSCNISNSVSMKCSYVCVRTVLMSWLMTEVVGHASSTSCSCSWCAFRTVLAVVSLAIARNATALYNDASKANIRALQREQAHTTMHGTQATSACYCMLVHACETHLFQAIVYVPMWHRRIVSMRGAGEHATMC
jgi:hypothetical protein